MDRETHSPTSCLIFSATLPAVKPPDTDIYLLLVFSKLALSSHFSRLSLHFLPLPNTPPTLKPFFSNLLLSHLPI